MVDLARNLDGISQREFRVGKAFGTAFNVFIKNIIPLSLISSIVWLPVLLLKIAALNVSKQEQIYWNLATVPLQMIVGSLISAVILYSTFQTMRGRSPKIGESVQRGLARLLPVLGLSFLMLLGMTVGFLLLVVPAFMLMVRWFVATPVCIVENKGPLASLKRSAELTQGNRWKIFGFYALVGIGGGVVIGILAALLVAFVPPIAVVVITTIAGAIIGAFSGVLNAVIYHDLRVAKEGIDIEGIASVFD